MINHRCCNCKPKSQKLFYGDILTGGFPSDKSRKLSPFRAIHIFSLHGERSLNELWLSLRSCRIELLVRSHVFTCHGRVTRSMPVHATGPKSRSARCLHKTLPVDVDLVVFEDRPGFFHLAKLDGGKQGCSTERRGYVNLTSVGVRIALSNSPCRWILIFVSFSIFFRSVFVRWSPWTSSSSDESFFLSVGGNIGH